MVETPPVLQATPENRCGVWVNGWGNFVDIWDDSFAKGYRFTTGGVTLGIDYRITDHFAQGLFSSYAHTWTDLRPGPYRCGLRTWRVIRQLFRSWILYQRGRFGGYKATTRVVRR